LRIKVLAKDEAGPIGASRDGLSRWESEIATPDAVFSRGPDCKRSLAVLFVTPPRLWPLSPVGL